MVLFKQSNHEFLLETTIRIKFYHLSQQQSRSYIVKLAKEMFFTRRRWEVSLATISFADLVSHRGSLNIQSKYPVVLSVDMLVKILDENGQQTPVRDYSQGSAPIKKEMMY